MLLIAGVLSQDSRKNWHGLSQILLRDLVLHVLRLAGRRNHRRLRSLTHGSRHRLSLRHSVSLHVLVHVAVLVVSHLVHVLLLTALVLLVATHGVSVLVVSGVVLSLVTRVHVRTAGLTHLVVLSEALTANVVRATSVATLRSLIHALKVTLLEKKTQQVHDLVRVLHLMEAARILGLVPLEVLLVLLHLILHVAVLLDLVVVDVERVVVNVMGSKLSLGITGLIGSLEANESEWLLLVLLREELERFNVTILAEKLVKTLLSHGGREALDIQVATLLRVLVLESLVLKLTFTLTLLEAGSNVKLLVLDNHVVALLHGTLSAAWAILSIIRIVAFEADESVWARSVFLQID